MRPSTRNLQALPDPARLESLARSIAMLEIIMYPDWKSRYYQYDPLWSPEDRDRLFRMENGSGDDYFLVFCPEGTFLKGFGHESYLTPWAEDPPKLWPGVLDAVPPIFKRFLNEPAFSMESTSFCIWRMYDDRVWSIGPIAFPEDEADPDGSYELLEMLDDDPATYRAFCAEYYEKQVPQDAIRAVYDGQPLTSEVVSVINPNAVWAEIVEEATTILYPIRT